MLTSLSSVTPRARLIQCRVVDPAVSSILLRHRHRQQARAFGFGWWASRCEDRDQQRDFRRRYMEAMQQKRSEAMNRRLLWEQQAQSGEIPRGFKRCGGRYWPPRRTFAFGRFSNRRDGFAAADKASTERPGQKNAENAENGAWGSFLFRDALDGKKGSKQSNSWATPLDDIRGYVARRHSELLKEAGFKFGSEPSAKTEEDYVIDPITNRKVSKSSSRSTPDDIASSTFKAYRARFESPNGTSKSESVADTRAMLDADLPPTAEELQAYRQVNVNDKNSQPDLSAISDSGDVSYMSWKYKGVFSGRSDGLPGKYSDLDKYRPVVDDASASASQADAVPTYDDLQKYKPVRHNEPDGKPPGVVEQEAHADLDSYKPVMYNEPDGKPTINAEPTVDASELAKYQPFAWNEPDGQPERAQSERAKRYNDTEVMKYQASRLRDPQEKPAPTPEDFGHDPAEVQKYQAVHWNEPDGQPKTLVEQGHHGYDQAEVQQYGPVRWNEPDGQPTTSTEPGHEGYDAKEVQKYKAVRYNEPNGQSAEPVEQGHLGYDQSEVEKYKAFRWNEPEGKSTTPAEPNHESYDSADVQKYKAFEYSEPDGKPVASASRGAGEERAKLESSLAHINAEADIIDKMTTLSIKSAKQRSAEEKMAEAERQQALLDPYSTEPQGLETSYSEECAGKSTSPPFVKIYSGKNKPEKVDAQESGSGSGSGSATATGSTIYKILAYDPATQEVSTVETTSTVHDTAVPLTPAEALLRLSHPTKFFSHFRPLEAQGYEIVSGNGDVLVFRKTLGSSGGAGDGGQGNRGNQGNQGNQGSQGSGIKRIRPAMPNPIDKTGASLVQQSPVIPTTADFASPTGYVNLERPSLLEEEAAADSQQTTAPRMPFRSNIDVRREEPVFSGLKSSEESKTKPMSLPKRMLVGATWVAGVSYVLGLVAEQLK